MSDKTTQASGGIGFFGALTIAFIVLKLMHFIDWSWLLVLCPIWGPLVLVLGIIVIYWLIIAGVLLYCGARKKKSKKKNMY